MAEADADALLAKLPEWRREGQRIVREWAFKDYREAMAFLRQVEDLAEEAGHHPDVHLERYRHVRLELWTHAAHGLTRNDFALAAKVGRLQDPGYAGGDGGPSSGADRPEGGAAHGGSRPPGAPHASMPGEVLVRGLEAECIIGTQPKERVQPQRVEIELRIGVDMAEAARSDRIGDTLDYKRLKDRLRAFVQASRYELLEALASAVAGIVLEEERALWVEVIVDKPGALTGSRSVAVRLRRSKPAA